MTDIQDIRLHAEHLMATWRDGRGTGADGGYTWGEYMDALDHHRDATKRHDWYAVAAWLAAQLVGERALTHADTHRAVLQIASIVHDYENRRRVGPPEEPAGDQPTFNLGDQA